ncbi:MAG: DUF3108 domain-containing protein [Spirochaetes bacterium]|nr:DUF3108 domain-containing protein [Spirochaetota bacterium]
MKRIPVVFLVIFFLVSTAVSASETLPFAVGERLRFFIYASKIYVGSQTVELVGTEDLGGNGVYRIHGVSRSSFFVSILYRLDDKWTVFIDRDTLLPRRVEKDMTEGRAQGFFIYDIDQEAGTVRIFDRDADKTEEVLSKTLVFDLFSLLYYYRANPETFYEPFTFDFLEPHALHTVQFKDMGTEEIIIPRISKKREVTARKLQQIGGIGIEIYISDDRFRVPLKMTVPSVLPGDKKLMIDFYIDRFEPGGGVGMPTQYESLAY